MGSRRPIALRLQLRRKRARKRANRRTWKMRQTNSRIDVDVPLKGTWEDRAEYMKFNSDARERGFIGVVPEQQLTVMKRALERLGLPVLYLASPMGEKLYTSEDGIGAADSLRAAHAMFATTFVGLARRFKRQPEVMQEFGAAHKLGAPKATLKLILRQLWTKHDPENREDIYDDGET